MKLKSLILFLLIQNNVFANLSESDHLGDFKVDHVLETNTTDAAGKSILIRDYYDIDGNHKQLVSYQNDEGKEVIIDQAEQNQEEFFSVVQKHDAIEEEVQNVVDAHQSEHQVNYYKEDGKIESHFQSQQKQADGTTQFPTYMVKNQVNVINHDKGLEYKTEQTLVHGGDLSAATTEVTDLASGEEVGRSFTTNRVNRDNGESASYQWNHDFTTNMDTLNATESVSANTTGLDGQEMQVTHDMSRVFVNSNKTADARGVTINGQREGTAQSWDLEGNPVASQANFSMTNDLGTFRHSLTRDHKTKNEHYQMQTQEGFNNGAQQDVMMNEQGQIYSSQAYIYSENEILGDIKTDNDHEFSIICSSTPVAEGKPQQDGANQLKFVFEKNDQGNLEPKVSITEMLGQEMGVSQTQVIFMPIIKRKKLTSTDLNCDTIQAAIEAQEMENLVGNLAEFQAYVKDNTLLSNNSPEAQISDNLFVMDQMRLGQTQESRGFLTHIVDEQRRIMSQFFENIAPLKERLNSMNIFHMAR